MRMTTIVYRAGTMAADSRAWGFDKAFIGEKTKVFRLDDGRLLGVSTAVIGLPLAVRQIELDAWSGGTIQAVTHAK